MANFEELDNVLTKAQMELLSKTLQLDKTNEICTDELAKVEFKGVTPFLKLKNAFAASFTSVDPEEQLLNYLGQQHEVFSGIGVKKDVDNYVLEDGKVNLFGESVRMKVWNEKAIKIQSAWRGMKCRKDLLTA